MDDEKKGKKMSSEQGNLLLEVWVFFLHKIQSKDNTKNSEMNRFKELFASMLKCILLLSQQSGSAISGVFFLKSWNINIKFPLILRISNYAYVWISLKRLFINKNKIKHYLFFQDLNPDQYVSAQQIRLLYSWWSKQNKDRTTEGTIQKRWLSYWFYLDGG